MPTSNDLPHLLRLLDDDSPVVQAEIQRAFCSLVPELQKLKPALSSEQQERLTQHLEPIARETLLSQWPEWCSRETTEGKLEYGLDCIARYQNGVLCEDKLAELLDELVGSFRKDNPHTDDPMELATYLFKERRLLGEKEQYYDPQNSNLIEVLREGKGNPISLTCIFILAANRVGMKVAGCNYPGHFLARVEYGQVLRFVDCFNGGQVLDSQLSKIEALAKPATAQTILTRVLHNLINSYSMLRQSETSDLFLYLLKITEQNLTTQDGPPDFSLGQLVEHRRYGYRGVVVDYDVTCKADEEWYRANRTQPEREQPWYRVLVDQSDKITYAAQSSLKPDSKGDQVKHPLVEVFFSGFKGDSYERNRRPWPKSRP